MRVLTCLAFWILALPLAAQYTQYHSEDKKALKYYEEARQFLKRAQFAEAMEPLQDALKRDPEFIEVWLALGSMHSRMQQDSLAVYYFQKALEVDPDYHKSKYVYFAIGEAYLKEARYEEAHEYLMHYLRTNHDDPKKERQARDMIADCRFAMEALKNPYNYNIEILPDHANHFKMQYFPALSVDQETLYFTRREGFGHENDEDVFFCTRDGEGWTVPKSISPNINTTDNEGAATISADGRMLVFTSCDGRRGYGSCDLYVSYKEGDNWSEPKNMGDEINSASWEAQPSLSADGRTIYFVSKRPNGFGGKDIYAATQNRRGKWQPAVNLGNKVNSNKDDISPFIHANGESLYFASNGHTGMGGLDIYRSELSDSVWSEPVNLGYPLNDAHDQLSLYISSDSRSGVYTIEKSIDHEFTSKLYSFDLPDTFQVTHHSAYLKGTVTDEKTGAPLASTIKIYKLDDSDFYSELESDKINGTYTIVLTEGNRYGIYVTSPGYIFKDFAFRFEDVASFDKNLLDIQLQKVEVGTKTVLGNIFFDFDDHKLKNESMSELRVVYYFLRRNPGVKVEISGHTDSFGSKNYNLQLSEKRAQTVYDFLISRGIKDIQLSYRGYGDQQPLSTEDTEDAHALNRRIEFKILQVE